MPYIKKDFIKNTLIPAVDIVRLIQQYVPLKKSGRDWKCCCPFHSEKTPSFNVSPQRGTFTCFGCNIHGNALDFIMQYKNLDFPEAVEELSRFAGLEVEYEQSAGQGYKREDRTKVLYEIMDRAAYFFTDQLNKNPQAMDYFISQRGLNPELIKKARLGYAPDDWSYAEQQLIKSPDEYQHLVTLGLQVDRQEDNGTHKRHAFFRGRVIFPIFDIKGRIIAFGGRVFANDFGPKYLNTPETPIFKKRNELFGLYEALQANRNRPEQIVVVEGYMDAIALRQAGYNYVVATLGTAITKDHLNQLFRFTDKVICCFDGDEAGKKATWRALKAVTPVLDNPKKEVYFVNITPGHDPDTLVREQGPEAFGYELKMAVSYSECIILHESKVYDISDPNSRARLIDSVLSIIKAMKSPTLQLVTLQVLSSYIDIDLSSLQNMLESSHVVANPEFIDVEGFERKHRISDNYQTVTTRYKSKDNLPSWAKSYNTGSNIKGIKVNHTFNRYPGPTPGNYPSQLQGQAPQMMLRPGMNVSPSPFMSNGQMLPSDKTMAIVSGGAPWGGSATDAQRSVSAQEFQQSFEREQLAQQQFTPAAAYMDLGPNGTPVSAGESMRASEDISGEYFAGGRGPTGNLMDRAQEAAQNLYMESGAALSLEQVAACSSTVHSNFALDPNERLLYRTVVGRNFNFNELNSAAYPVLAFVLQNPNIVANVYESFKLDYMLEYAKALRTVEYPCLERLLALIKAQPTTTCAALLEEFRDTEFEGLFDYLSNGAILPNTSDNDEFDLNTKTIYFGNFIFKMLKEPFIARITELKQSSMQKEDFAELMALNRVVERNLDGKKGVQ